MILGTFTLADGGEWMIETGDPVKVPRADDIIETPSYIDSDRRRLIISSTLIGEAARDAIGSAIADLIAMHTPRPTLAGYEPGELGPMEPGEDLSGGPDEAYDHYDRAGNFWTCRECPRAFGSEGAVRAHVRRVHRLDPGRLEDD